MWSRPLLTQIEKNVFSIVNCCCKRLQIILYTEKIVLKFYQSASKEVNLLLGRFSSVIEKGEWYFVFSCSFTGHFCECVYIAWRKHDRVLYGCILEHIVLADLCIPQIVLEAEIVWWLSFTDISVSGTWTKWGNSVTAAKYKIEKLNNNNKLVFGNIVSRT